MQFVKAYRSVLDYESEESLTQAIREMCCNSTSPSSEATDAVSAMINEEAARLQNLREYQIIETENEPAFDELASKVRVKFDASWAFVSFVDLERVWFKSLSSAPGRELNLKETSRVTSFCSRAINKREGTPVFEIPDMLQDPRYSGNPFVTNHPNARWYAGAPLVSPEGYRLGMLCVVDNKPRSLLSMEDTSYLLNMASETVRLFVQRRQERYQKQAGGSGEIGQNSSSSLKEVEKAAGSNAEIGASSSETEDDKATKKRAASKRRAAKKTERGIRSDHCDSSDCSMARKKSRSPTPPSPRPRSSRGISAQAKPTQAAAKQYDSDSDASVSSTSLSSDDHSISTIILKPALDAPMPDPNTSDSDPDTFLLQLVEAMYGAKLKVQDALSLGDFFPKIREDQMAAYNMDVLSAARENNVVKLKELLEQRGRASLDCFNRFGEGLLNLACRRGFQDMVGFLLSPSVGLSLRVRDDYGRTPCHDACWNPEPQLDICSWIIQQDPSLFLVADKRGYTPFQYARPGDWRTWRNFLFEHRQHLELLVQPEILARFS